VVVMVQSRVVMVQDWLGKSRVVMVQSRVVMVQDWLEVPVFPCY
jgi:hypothetical protein